MTSLPMLCVGEEGREAVQKLIIEGKKIFLLPLSLLLGLPLLLALLPSSSRSNRISLPAGWEHTQSVLPERQ